jgi:uncharacterized protein YodC (DUF2158 family)
VGFDAGGAAGGAGRIIITLQEGHDISCPAPSAGYSTCCPQRWQEHLRNPLESLTSCLWLFASTLRRCSGIAKPQIDRGTYGSQRVLTGNIGGCIKITVRKRSAFKVGDVVELKSGGPRMIVTATATGNKLRCSWFAGTKHNSALLPFQSVKVPDADARKELADVMVKAVYGTPAERKALPPAPTEPAAVKSQLPPR